ncbi:RNA polymerase factor sigma-54 [Desulfurivibrio alkaliphilus]|uniref:RNA polymerase, sigma 54 subunit, RpoN n=1 Tax=Desulfurivibrio alkaliphilus (strain DSM 19089 / UNIQEM U267 / AHT2) TaxID=589865 RepID=D6Z6A6_DESAT|nr:RNA polymerase factor sigma-54 [Desulfurivibrio alkaliphilus]ADH86871.1 RNA polymerase, sigma 54 subunit, RpoN [Desulfurivibrio alkaliphilus AHT 2]
MALELRQSLKLSQQLVMTPQLQQAIKLLQLSRLELMETVQQELEVNPVLEEGLDLYEDGGNPADDPLPDSALAGNNGPEEELGRSEPEQTAEISMDSSSALGEIDWGNYLNEYAGDQSDGGYSGAAGRDDDAPPSRLEIMSVRPSLQSHLQWQLNLSHISDREKEIGEFIIGNLDENGFLLVSPEEICSQTDCTPAEADHLLSRVQEMDPAGVGAQDLRHCLLLQLARLEAADSLAARIVRDHLSLLETRNYPGLAKATGASTAEVSAAVEVITGLNPRPGRLYSDADPVYIVPDVYVYKLGEEYVIMLNDEGLPRLRISNYYRDILDKDSTAPGATKDYVQDKLRSAMWLIKSIQQRQRTIYRVVESLLKFQRDFFEHGVNKLKPMVLRDVAEDIGMHESTISRVTTNKYVHTPQGTFELKYFFNSTISTEAGDGMASESIKQRLKSIVQHEDRKKPLSDSAIAAVFSRDGIRLARRTVAKYREQLGILPSKLRRRP